VKFNFFLGIAPTSRETHIFSSNNLPKRSNAMKKKRRVQIATEVDPDLWQQFREQAFAENLTTGQLLDKLIATYLEMVQN